MIKEENHDENHGEVYLRWFWIRHAPVQAREGVFTGSSDVPAHLDTARTEIENLAKLLPLRPAFWVASTLQRARQTAQALREALHEAPHKVLREEGADSEQVLIYEALNDEALNEQNFGDWEGERYDEVKHRALWDAPATHRPPNGESFADLVSRVARAIKHIEGRIEENIQENVVAKEASVLTVVAVAHAGTIRAALAQALALPPQRALSFVIDPLSLTRIDRYRHHEARSSAELSASLSSSVRCVNVRQIVKQE